MSFTGNLKKTLAIILSATVLSSVGVMAASAEGAVNFLPSSNAGITGENAEVVIENGVVKITASGATEVAIPVNQTYDIVDNPNLYLDMTVEGSNITFAIDATGQESATSDKDYTVKLEGDYGPQFGNATEADGIAPGTYTFNADDPEGANNRLELIGSVRFAIWGGGTHMAEIQPDLGRYTVRTLRIGFKDVGSVELREMYAGVESTTDVPTNPTNPSVTDPSTSETEPTTPPTVALVEKSVSLLGDAADWNYDSAAMTVTAGENGGLVFANTNGQWPSADYAYDTPITFDPKTAKISYDITVGSATNVNLFFKDSFPGSTDGENNFADDGYISLPKYMGDAQLDPGSGDLTGVNTQYKGVIDLSQVEFPAGCLNDDGTVTLNAINIFSIGAADVSSVVYADLTLTYMAEADSQPTDPTTDDTTASTDATDSTAASNSTAATTGKQNPTTGESTAMIAAGLVLMAASAGAVALCAKKKAR
mgnify:FL=1